MNKRGFTLVEIMIIAAILATLCTIIFVATVAKNDLLNIESSMTGSDSAVMARVMPDVFDNGQDLAHFPDVRGRLDYLLFRLHKWQEMFPDKKVVDRVGDGEGGIFVFYEKVPLPAEVEMVP